MRLHNLESDFFAFVMPWGRYLDTDKCSVGVSSWRRPGSNCLAPQAKISGQYINSALAKTEAFENGFDEAIVLNEAGRVAEGSGENIFVVKDGKIFTPPFINSILPGITRASVMQLAKDAGIEIAEMFIPREMVYIADEVFFTGTAAEITPIRSVDRMKIGKGALGDVTRELQKRFFSVVEDGVDPHGWLNFI